MVYVYKNKLRRYFLSGLSQEFIRVLTEQSKAIGRTAQAECLRNLVTCLTDIKKLEEFD